MRRQKVQALPAPTSSETERGVPIRWPYQFEVGRRAGPAPHRFGPDLSSTSGHRQPRVPRRPPPRRHRAPRPADPSLRKSSRPETSPGASSTAPECHPGLPRGANRHLPRCATSDSWRSLRSARVPPVRYRDKPVPTPERGHDWTPIRGQTSAPIDIAKMAALGGLC